MRSPKTKPSARANRTEGIEQLPECPEIDANERRIAELRAALDAAAAVGGKAKYTRLWAVYLEALRARDPEQTHRLEEQRRKFVEHSVAKADHGRAVAWSTSRPVDAEAASRGTA